MEKPVPRSAGVTAAATLALLGCCTSFLVWGFVLLRLLNAPLDDAGRHFYQLYPLTFLVIAFVPSALIAAGIRTGIGLFELRPWARVAAIFWAVITLLFCLGLIALRPFETFVIPDDHFVGDLESLKQLSSVALIILLLPSSIWWLFLFRSNGVKRQFQVAEEQRCAIVSPVTASE